jgi:hypothetical protein
VYPIGRQLVSTRGSGLGARGSGLGIRASGFDRPHERDLKSPGSVTPIVMVFSAAPESTGSEAVSTRWQRPSGQTLSRVVRTTDARRPTVRAFPVLRLLSVRHYRTAAH